MTFRKYRPLKPREIERTLKKNGFTLKHTVGSHHQWEGYVNGIRHVVTVPHYDEIKSKDLLKSIFENSGLGWQKFY